MEINKTLTEATKIKKENTPKPALQNSILNFLTYASEKKRLGSILVYWSVH